MTKSQKKLNELEASQLNIERKLNSQQEQKERLEQEAGKIPDTSELETQLEQVSKISQEISEDKFSSVSNKLDKLEKHGHIIGLEVSFLTDLKQERLEIDEFVNREKEDETIKNAECFIKMFADNNAMEKLKLSFCKTMQAVSNKYNIGITTRDHFKSQKSSVLSIDDYNEKKTKYR